MNKKLILILSITAIMILVIGCTTEDPRSINNEKIIMTEEGIMEDEGDSNDMLYLTKDELYAFDGTNGLPAYICVEGIIYDVTDHPQWKDGMHQGVKAGSDVTTEIYDMSPHGVKVLDALPIVGYLIED